MACENVPAWTETRTERESRALIGITFQRAGLTWSAVIGDLSENRTAKKKWTEISQPKLLQTFKWNKPFADCLDADRDRNWLDGQGCQFGNETYENHEFKLATLSRIVSFLGNNPRKNSQASITDMFQSSTEHKKYTQHSELTIESESCCLGRFFVLF